MLSQLLTKKKSFFKKALGVSIIILFSVNNVNLSAKDAKADSKLSLLEVNFLPFKKSDSNKADAEAEAIGLTITTQGGEEANANAGNATAGNQKVQPNTNVKMYSFFYDYTWSEYSKGAGAGGGAGAEGGSAVLLPFEEATFFNAFKQLKSLSFCGIYFSISILKNFITSSQHLSLSNLSITSCDIDDYDALAKFISTQKQVTSITFQGYVTKDGKRNTTEQICKLLEQLEGRKNITCLKLAFTFLTAEIAEKIANIIKSSGPVLKELAIEFQEPYHEDPEQVDHYNASVHYRNEQKLSCIQILYDSFKQAKKVRNLTLTILDHDVKIVQDEEDKKADKKVVKPGKIGSDGKPIVNEVDTDAEGDVESDNEDEDEEGQSSNVKLLQKDIDIMCNAIHYLKNLRKIKLCFGKAIINKLLSASGIKGESNGCDLHIGKPLAIAFSRLGFLKKIDLSEANFDAMTTESVVDGLKNRVVKKAHNEETKTLEYQHIENLDLSNNIINKKVGAALQEMLNNKTDSDKSSLQGVYLLSCSNCGITDEIAKELCKNLPLATNLQFFDLSNNKVKKVSECLDGIDKNVNLETLNLRRNFIFPQGVTDFLKSYSNKNRLNLLLEEQMASDEVVVVDGAGGGEGAAVTA